MKKLRRYTPAVLDTEMIAKLRVKKGLSQEEAAKAAGKSGRQWWNNIESGRQTTIGIDTLDLIAKVLGVHARELLK